MAEDILAWFCGSMAADFSIIFKCSPQKPVFCVIIFMDGTRRYRPKINKSRPQIRAALDLLQQPHSSKAEINSSHGYTIRIRYNRLLCRGACMHAWDNSSYIVIAQVNAKDRYGFTPLHVACQSSNKEAVESLLKHEDINLTIRDGNGDTPLHEACFHGHEEIVKILLNKMKTNGKPDVTKVNIKNNAGLTPFHIACREDHYEIVNLLLNTHQDLLKERDNDKATPLHYACRNDNVKIVTLLMDKSSSLTPQTSDGVTPIHVAAQYGCVKVMEEFLKKVKEVVNVRDTYNQTPLHYATEYGKIDMMKLLLERYMYTTNLQIL